MSWDTHKYVGEQTSLSISKKKDNPKEENSFLRSWVVELQQEVYYLRKENERLNKELQFVSEDRQRRGWIERAKLRRRGDW